MDPTPILVSWSGGKDAAWTLHQLRHSPRHTPVALLTTVTAGHGRVAMHGIRREVLHAQAEAAGLPLIEACQPHQPDNASYESAFAAALGQARQHWPELAHIAFGDLFLEEVRGFRDALLARHGWQGVYPLWGSDTAALARAMLRGGLQARLCCVDSGQLATGFAGRAFDADLLADLPAGVDPCGERGEFHTLVHAGPMLRHPLRLECGENRMRDGRFMFTDFTLAPGPGAQPA